MSPAVQEETACRTPIFSFDEFGENFISIRYARTAVYRENLNGIGPLGQVKMAQIVGEVRACPIHDPVLKHGKQFRGPIGLMQIRKFDQQRETRFLLGSIRACRVTEAV